MRTHIEQPQTICMPVSIMATPLREFAMSETDFRFLGDLATHHTGIIFPSYKKDLIYGRLTRRLRALGLSNFEDYCMLLQGEAGTEEIPHMVNAVTTNLTSFFREAHHFAHLEQAVLKPFAQATNKPRLRIWSAACSSGMEAYSIAMALLAACPQAANYDVKILATDIDSRMLEIAREATYPVAEEVRIPEAYKRFVTQNEDVCAVRQEVLNLVSFKRLNLIESWPMKGPFDAIFCRNVVIYFDKETKRTLFDRLADMLTVGGYLYIGHSENLNGLTERFTQVGRTTYQRVV
jgi:chemotaxis protein methyltransferase CheR